MNHMYCSYNLAICITFRYGPLIRHWTMRYETKHSYFKSLAQAMGNFINIEFSLAMRHQFLQCYEHSVAKSSPGDELCVGPGKYHCDD